jgi:hypothetical protein
MCTWTAKAKRASTPIVTTRQEIEHLLEPLLSVAVAREQPAANGVGRSPKAIELKLEQPVAMIEWHRAGQD